MSEGNICCICCSNILIEHSTTYILRVNFFDKTDKSILFGSYNPNFGINYSAYLYTIRCIMHCSVLCLNKDMLCIVHIND